MTNLEAACGHGAWFRMVLHSIHRRADHFGWYVLQASSFNKLLTHVHRLKVIGDEYDYKIGHPLSDQWLEEEMRDKK